LITAQNGGSTHKDCNKTINVDSTLLSLPGQTEEPKIIVFSKTWRQVLSFRRVLSAIASGLLPNSVSHLPDTGIYNLLSIWIRILLRVDRQLCAASCDFDVTCFFFEATTGEDAGNRELGCTSRWDALRHIPVIQYAAYLRGVVINILEAAVVGIMLAAT
jgi:hypothetical protein